MYSQVFDAHAALLKALAHPRRLEIVHLLRDQALCVSDLYLMLDLQQANVSQHLQILRQADVVKTTRQGKQVVYSLKHPNLILASDLLRQAVLDLHPKLNTSDSNIPLTQLVPLTSDPVCHMRLSPKTAGFSSKYNNQTYYFCASGCLAAFTKQPEKYV